MADLSDYYEKTLACKSNSEINIVKVHYDPSVIKRKGKTSSTDIKAKMGLSSLGAESNDKKYTRRLQLELAIRNKRVSTLQEAMALFGNSRATVINYLKEVGLQLVDEKNGKFVGADRVSSTSKIIVYDKDPLKGGKPINDIIGE